MKHDISIVFAGSATEDYDRYLGPRFCSNRLQSNDSLNRA